MFFAQNPNINKDFRLKFHDLKMDKFKFIESTVFFQRSPGWGEWATKVEITTKRKRF